MCNAEREIDSYSLKNSGGPKCTACTGKSAKGKIDLTGKQFGQWKVLEYAGDRKWKCQCSCGVIKAVSGSDLRNGKSTNCGHLTNRRLEDLTGKRFGEWEVLSKGETGANGETRWLCRCSCGKQSLVTAYALKSGSSKSCGHFTTGFQDLTGQQFGNWKVLHKSDIQMQGGSTMWTCECQCKNHTIRDISSYDLRYGISKSCGCLTNKLREETNLSKYGVKYAAQINTKRSPDQIKMTSSKEDLEAAIDSFGHKPSAIELGNKIGINRGSAKNIVEKYGLSDKIQHNIQNISGYEKWLEGMYPCNSISNREILDGKEIDLFYPEHNFGIEFNGNYWHSELKKDAKYHQEKSMLATLKGIQLFHIFEYEWNDKDTKTKILNILDTKLKPETIQRYGARNCQVGEVKNSNLIKEFLNKYHLQGYIGSQVNIGIAYDRKLLGLMIFGKPRFNNGFEYELLRVVWADHVIVSGGLSKMFKYFVDNYHPISIITYCDYSKFDGSGYKAIGMKGREITQPGYRWVNIETNKALTRYQTMKKDLVSKGLGTEDQTESEIMHNLGYYKVYDCGNLVFTWES